MAGRKEVFARCSNSVFNSDQTLSVWANTSNYMHVLKLFEKKLEAPKQFENYIQIVWYLFWECTGGRCAGGSVLWAATGFEGEPHPGGEDPVRVS